MENKLKPRLALYTALISLLTLFSTPVSAAPLPTIAVIDVGANTSLFKNIVTEVCIVEMLSCPNKKSFMEGTGAADTGVPINKALDHGTNMLSIINKVNPQVGLIPIRIVTTTSTGVLGLYTNNAVKSALDWVVTNREKYNIVAVSISQGKLFSACTLPAGTTEAVATLKNNNVPVIAAAGNNGDLNQTMSISCGTGVISVGATDNPDPGTSGIAYCKTCAPTIAKYSNGNPTFYLNGRWYVMQGDGSTKFTVGTSNATASLAGWWSLVNKGTIADTFSYLNGTAVTAQNGTRTGRYIALP